MRGLEMNGVFGVETADYHPHHLYAVLLGALIVVEMVLFSFLHLYAFDYTRFEACKNTSLLSRLMDVLNLRLIKPREEMELRHVPLL